MFCVTKHCGEKYGDASDVKLQDEMMELFSNKCAMCNLIGIFQC